MNKPIASYYNPRFEPYYYILELIDDYISKLNNTSQKRQELLLLANEVRKYQNCFHIERIGEPQVLKEENSNMIFLLQIVHINYQDIDLTPLFT